MNNISAAILEWARRTHYHNGDTQRAFQDLNETHQKAVTKAAHDLLDTNS